MKAAFVVNPAARGHDAGALETLLRGFPDARVLRTEAAGDGSRLAALALDEGAELVVSCGGDGTFREVASAVGGRALLGLLPLGTVNLLALELGLPRDPEGALAVLRSGAERPVYPGRCRADGEADPRPFFIGVSAGPDADAVHAVGPEKRRLGRYAYALRLLLRMLRPVTPEIGCRWDGKDGGKGGEGGDGKFGQVVVLRAPHYGGRYRMSEGLTLGAPGLELVAVTQGRLAVVSLFADALGSRVREPPGRTRRRVREVRLALPAPGRCQIDGDPLLARGLTLWPDPEPLRVLAPG